MGATGFFAYTWNGQKSVIAGLADKVGFGGIASYGQKTPNMVHIDSRPTDMAWGPNFSQTSINSLKDKALSAVLNTHNTHALNTTVSPRQQALEANAAKRGLLEPIETTIASKAPSTRLAAVDFGKPPTKTSAPASKPQDYENE